MEYKDIVKALRCYSEMVEASSQKFNASLIVTSSDPCADFEEIVCNYIDALDEIKHIKNRNKRYCLVYEALGYEQWQIARMLGVNQSTISRHISWLKRLFKKTA